MSTRQILRQLAIGAAALNIMATAAASASADMVSDLGRDAQIADSAWPDSPCRGHLKFRIDHAAFAGTSWAAFAPLGGNPAAIDGCLITMDPTYFATKSPSVVCDHVIHEAGHLAGHDHAASGVMRPLPEHFAGCDRALTVREQIVDDLYRQHGGLTSPSVSVQCGKWQGRVLPCRVRLSSHTVRYRVRSASVGYATVRVHAAPSGRSS